MPRGCLLLVAGRNGMYREAEKGTERYCVMMDGVDAKVVLRVV